MPVMSVLKAWIIFNVLISSYELYIISIRQRLIPQHCKSNFWREPADSLPRFQAYWTEYACKVDWRYFKTNSYVYIIEFINVVTTLFLILFYKTAYIPYILTIQLMNCLAYFFTIERLPIMNPQNLLYLTISSLWIFIPIYLINSHDTR